MDDHEGIENSSSHQKGLEMAVYLDFVDRVGGISREESKSPALQAYAEYAKETNPAAVGAVTLSLDCGCIRVLSFDQDGESVGTEAILRNVGSGNDICKKCLHDHGTDPSRILESAILWFTPSTLSRIEREWIPEKILSTRPIIH